MRAPWQQQASQGRKGCPLLAAAVKSRLRATVHGCQAPEPHFEGVTAWRADTVVMSPGASETRP